MISLRGQFSVRGAFINQAADRLSSIPLAFFVLVKPYQTMDTLMTSLPPNVGAILMENISIIQIVSMFSIGAYNALETGIVTFDSFKRYRGLYF